ncbi:MAG: signal peptidase I, partial [Planctomycetes bacterium]|nr:signal peptidase I [Planctomycetota bacterium]
MPKEITSNSTDHVAKAGPLRTALICAVLSVVLLLLVFVVAGAGLYEVEGTSMSGSFSPGDVVLVESLSLWLRIAPARFDVVVIRDPDNAGSYMMKRVAGLPGEKLEL